MERHVRVRFYREGRGYKYVVLSSTSLNYIAEGWSAGSRREAEQTFLKHACESGWVTDAMRAERMKGAA